jgi:hypothetical protein
MNKNNQMKIFTVPNSSGFLRGIVKLVAYFLLVLLNILLYYHFSLDQFGELIADFIFFTFLLLFFLSFSVEYRWSYSTSIGEVLVKVESNILGFNFIKILIDGNLIEKKSKKGRKFIKLDLENIKGFSMLVIKKCEDNQVLCRFE